VGGVYAFPAQPTPCLNDVCTPLGVFSGATGGSQFGQSVALVDGTLLIGAPAEDVDGTPDVGAAFLASINQSQRPQITNPESSPLAGDQFGFTVASIENDILIGAPLLGSTDTGAVFVFDKRTRQRRTTLRNPVPTTGDFFGAAIAVDGDTVAVGAPLDGTAAWKAGAVYLFRRSTAELLQGKPLVSLDAQPRELFGASVAISPELIVVGAPSDDPGQPGRAYVFDRQSRGLVQILENPSQSAGDRFGAAVAIIDGRVLVGAPLADLLPSSGAPGAADAGVTYLIDPASNRVLQRIENPERGAFDRFGTALAPAPSGFLIGAPGPGRVFVFRSVAAGGLAVTNAIGGTTEAARCGNGIREGAEQCDDGNDIDTDDCTNACVPRCCVIDPLATARCNDYDPCTNDSVDPVSGACINVDNGQCCTSDAACSGQNDVCRLCAGCSLFAWDCCDQGATCLLSSPECQNLPCFEKPLCECQGGLTCSEPGSKPTDEMNSLFLEACDSLRQEDASSNTDNPVGQARMFAKQSRKALKDARRMTKRGFKAHSISKTCRGEYLDTINRALRAVPGGNKLRTCARQKISES
jgi:cysteine-rich repeat protein